MQNFLENITFRRPRNNSESDVNNSHIRERTLDDTTNSLPNISDDDDASEQLKQMREKIENLTLELQSAHEEIAALNIENTKLQTKNDDLIRQNQLLKTVTSSPKSQKTPLRTKSHSNAQLCSHKKLHPEIDETKLTATNSEVSGKKQLHKKNTASKARITRKISNTNLNSLMHTQKTQHMEKQPKTDQQRKPHLCVISGRNNNVLQNLEDTFAKKFTFCHFSKPAAQINELLMGIETKVCKLTKEDFCIILLGESDIKMNQNYISVIQLLRNTLKKITHTNVIICPPTYICGALMFNYRAEQFINLLYLDVETHKHCWFLDTNKNLSLDMFSSFTGKLNKYGMRQIINDIKKFIEMGSTTNFDLQDKDYDPIDNDTIFFRD